MTAETAKRHKGLRLLRAVSVLLAVLLLLGLGLSLVLASRAASLDAEADNPLIRVALVYGTAVKHDYGLRADHGMILGYADANKVFTPILTTEATTLHACRDGNMVFTSSKRYILAGNGQTVQVGGYHIALDCSPDEVEAIARLLPEESIFSFWQDGKQSLLLGQYTSENAAAEALVSLKNDFAMTDTEEPTPFQKALATATVNIPSHTAVVLVDPSTHRIVWKFESSDAALRVGVQAIQTEEEHTHLYGMPLPYYYAYDGTLLVSPNQSGSARGIQVVNQLPLERYVAGVIPYEVSNAWPLETLKAFAIAVRSYTVSHFNKHNGAYGADLCNTVDCQVYRGFASANARVLQAVAETEGVIAVYNGRICSTFYSSSTGGCTANVWEVWGSNPKTYPYLRAAATPWEKYSQYGNGTSTVTATGQQIYERLKARGYTALDSAVTDITYTTGENTSYVYTITFTDKNGHTLTLKGCENISINLSPYVNSANFVVCQSGETVTRLNYTKMGFGNTTAEPTLGVLVRSYPNDHLLVGRQEFSVLTAHGTHTFSDSNTEYVMSDTGIHEYNLSHSLDSQYYPTIIGVNGQELPDLMSLKTLVESETLQTEGDGSAFVFIGRGWGHGVGLSQFGIKDLGDLGYDYETIFKAYYSGVDLITYADYLGVS
ncbi:MAG: SpoIID/LytB domain-containing protein [Ruminococcaceae bacterium]|nr:SpoIID/LytB domain-containing protein [Oscillospiraceae bacterium]